MANNKVEPQKENELNVLSDSVPCEARQETILAVLRQRYFSTSDSVLAIRLGVDKGILKRYVDRKKRSYEESTNSIWDSLKSYYGFKPQELLNACVVLDLSLKMSDDADARNVKKEKIAERWIACFLKSQSPFDDKEQAPKWWLELNQLFANNPQAFFETLAAFYLRQKGLFSVNRHQSHRKAAYRSFMLQNDETLEDETWYSLNKSQPNVALLKSAYEDLANYLRSDFKLLEYFEAYADMYDVLLQRLSFSAAVSVAFGSFLLRSAIDPFAFLSLNQVGKVMGLGKLSWWYAENTLPSDEKAHVWAILEPTITTSGERIPLMYVWLEFEVLRQESKFSFKMCKLHQPVFDDWRKQMRCNTFTDNAMPAYSNYCYELSDDKQTLCLDFEENAATSRKTKSVLPSTLCRIEKNDEWVRLVRQNENYLIKESHEWVPKDQEQDVLIRRLLDFKLQLFFSVNGWKPYSPEELLVTDVIVGRKAIEIKVEGKDLSVSKVEVPLSTDERLRQVLPSDEIIPVSIKQTNTKKGEERYVTAFYWPKLDFAITVNHLHSKEGGSVDSSGRGV